MSLYFIGFPIEGEVGEYITRLTKDIVDRFNLYPLHKRVPPHITIFPPFECTNLFLLNKKIQILSDTLFVDNFILEGFDHFDFKSIYMHVFISHKLQAEIESVINFIKLQDEVVLKGKLFKGMKLHTSLSRHIPPDTFKYVWDYVNTFPSIQFHLRFDQMALFVLTAHGWKIGRKYYIKEKSKKEHK